MWKIRAMDIKELQVDDRSYNEGTICLEKSEWVPRGWFFKCGQTTGIIKLAMAGNSYEPAKEHETRFHDYPNCHDI